MITQNITVEIVEHENITVNVDDGLQGLTTAAQVRNVLSTLTGDDRLDALYIKNLSTFSQIQSDWNQATNTAVDYIKNKPSSLPASDVYAWAKASTKPSYTTSEVGAQPALNGTGFVKISGTTISYDNSTYLTSYTETDPVVKAINGIVKSNGTTISAASAGTDYQLPIGTLTANKIVVGNGTNDIIVSTVDIASGNITLADAGTINLSNNVTTNSVTNNAISLVNSTLATASLTNLLSPSLFFSVNGWDNINLISKPQPWTIVAEGASSSSGFSYLKFKNETNGVLTTRMSLYSNGVLLISGIVASYSNSNSYSVTTYPTASYTQSHYAIAQSSATSGTSKRYGSYHNRSTAYFGGLVYTYNWRQTVDPIAETEDYLNLEYFADNGTIYMPYRFGRMGNYRLLGNYEYALSTAMVGATAPTPATDDKRLGQTTANLLELDNYESSNWANKVTISKTGALLTQGTIESVGLANLPMPYASFSHSATLTVVSATAEYAIPFDTEEAKYNITHSTSTNPSYITIPVAGTYLITFSAVGKSAVANKTLDIWAKIDGTNVARTNTISRFVGAANERIITVTYILSFTAGQRFELFYNSNDTGTVLLATAAQANPTRPACPSIILTINKISK